MPSRFAALSLAALVVPAAVATAELPVPEVLLWAGPAPTLRAGSAAPTAPGVAPQSQSALQAAPLVRLVWIDPSGIASGAESVAKLAVTELLLEMGVDSRWRHGDPQELSRPGELRVIFLNRPGNYESGMSVLGATPTRFAGDPCLWVHVPSVGDAVGVERLRNNTALDAHTARRLGLGLARVVAHELVHAIAPSLPHGKGLMAARLDRRMLTDPRIAVDPNLGLALRAALLGARPAAPVTDTILAAESTREEPE